MLKIDSKKVLFFCQNRIKESIYYFFIKLNSLKTESKKYLFFWAKLNSLKNRINKSIYFFLAKLNSPVMETIVENRIKKSIYYFFVKLNSLKNESKKYLFIYFFWQNQIH